MTSRACRPSKTVLPLRVGAFSLIAGLGCASLAPAAIAAPEEDAAPGTGDRVFEPAFYAAFSPQSALDMVSQTPGFSIKEEGGKRGMGAGDANVLVDNRRLPAKSMTVREALGRIDASRVVRIEIVDGARMDVPGLSGQVVNVITRPAGMSVRWEWSPEVSEGADLRLERGRVVIGGDLDNWEYSAGLSSFAWNGSSEGPEVLLNAAGEAIEFRDEVDRWKGRRHELSTALSHEGFGGDISSLGLVLAASKDSSNEQSNRTGAIDYLRDYRFANAATTYKLNADHEFAFGPGRLKLIGLRSGVSSEPVTTTVIERADAPASGARVNIDKSSGESILRGEYAWAADGDWQMALESAVNTLETDTAYAVLANGAYAPVPIAGGTAQVEEKRAEAALIHGRALGDGVFLQASLAAEHSEIAQSGPNGKVREFVRPKGFLALSWTPVQNWNANIRVERAVGQLDFGDFISSVNLADESGQQQSGNPEVVPEQSWDIALEANGDLHGLGPIRVKLYGRQIEDVNGSVVFSRIVTDTGAIIVTEGPGNLDHAVSYGLDLSGTLATPLGIPGGKLDWTASLRDSSIDDAVTGEARPLSGQRKAFYALNFRQDFPGTPWAWGLNYEDARHTPGFGVTQVTRRSDSTGRMGAFVQHKDIAGMKARLSVSNLLDNAERFTRTGHSGTVADQIAFTEDRTRTQGLQVGLNLSGSF